MDQTNSNQIIPETPQSNATPSRTRSFYQRHKVISISFVIITLLFLCLEVFAGGSPIVSCAVGEINPLSGFNLGSCPSEVGNKTLIPQLCSALPNFQASDICRGSYAITHNRLDICEQTSEQLTTGKPYCIQALAVKNKNIGLCDDLSNISRGSCRDGVRYDLFYNGPNRNQYISTQGQWDPCPGDDPTLWQDGFEATCKIRKSPIMSVCKDAEYGKRLECYLEIAKEQQNPELCNVFGEGYNHEYEFITSECLQQIGKGSKMMSKDFTTLPAPASELNIIMDLSMATLTGSPGETVQVKGTIQNSSAGTVYINSISGSFSSENLDMERSYFNTVIPHTYKTGKIYKGPLFGIVIDKNIKPGTYSINFSIIGGRTPDDWQELTNQNLQIKIQ
jgi:hypothetical protein